MLAHLVRRIGGPGVGRGRQPAGLADGAGEHGGAGAAGAGGLGDELGPVHDEVGVDQLGAGREVEPDLEQAEPVGPVGAEQGEHLAMDDAAAGGHPLAVAAAVSATVAPAGAWGRGEDRWAGRGSGIQFECLVLAQEMSDEM